VTVTGDGFAVVSSAGYQELLAADPAGIAAHHGVEQAPEMSVDVIGSQAGGSPTRGGGALPGFDGATNTS